LKFIRLLVVFSILGTLTACAPSPGRATYVAAAPNTKTAFDWMELVCKLIKSESVGALQASRIIAYSGVALYESCLPGMTGCRSLSGQLSEMPNMPLPEAGKVYDWTAVIAAAMSETLGVFFTGSGNPAASITALKDSQISAQNITGEVRGRSEAYGKSIADTIISWASTDGYQDIRGMNYTPAAGDGMWVPTPPTFSQPVEPYWGTLRPFALASADCCSPAAPFAYSTDKNSVFFQQAMAVYEASESLTDEQIAIALFWADNTGESFTPAGHWLAIENQMADQLNLTLPQTVEMYALTGIASADAFISVWQTKFQYNVQRPVTYINANIDPGWLPVLFTPSFPEYTPAHSVVSGACAAVLSGLLGKVPFTDNSYQGIGITARSFNSFEEAAGEASLSRLYAGVHYPISNQNGLKQGEYVAMNVLNRVRTKE
jgi:hypothetical protein